MLCILHTFSLQDTVYHSSPPLLINLIGGINKRYTTKHNLFWKPNFANQNNISVNNNNHSINFRNNDISSLINKKKFDKFEEK